MSFRDIEHVVLVILENRSFDSLLGWMSHPRFGSHPVEGLTGPLSGSSLTNPSYTNHAVNRTFQPFFDDADCECLADLPHGRGEIATQMAWDALQQQYTMTGFAESYFHNNSNMGQVNPQPPENLRMHGPNAAPVTSFLARNFVVCDHWFTPIPTDTHPNRMMALAGYSQIETTGRFEPDHRVVFDWANDNQLSWAVYGDGFSFMSLMRLARTVTDPHYRHLGAFDAEYRDSTRPFPAVTLVEPEYLDDPFVSHPNDNHPPLAMGPGEQFLLDIYKTLTRNPARWARTMLVVYYDEHGGYFDHVPPLWVETPCGRPANQTQWRKFVTTGPRVPAIVASPLLDAGVYSGNLDHTSVLRFLANRFTPAAAFSHAVKARHDSPTAGLTSLADLTFRTTPRVTPVAPSFGSLMRIQVPAPRPATTAGQLAFADARARAPRDRP